MRDRIIKKFKLPTLSKKKLKQEQVEAAQAPAVAGVTAPSIATASSTAVINNISVSATASASDDNSCATADVASINHLKVKRPSDPLLGGLTEHQLYDQAIIREYDEASDTLRKFILLNHSTAQRNILYARYLKELETAIDDHTNPDIQKLARDVIDQVKYAHAHFLQQYDGYKVDDLYLFDVLHSTAKLISTAPLDENGVLSEAFILNTEKFKGVMDTIRTDGTGKALSCTGYALLTALVLVAGIMIGVLTFGAFAVTALTISVITFGIINMGGQFGFGVYTGMKTVGLFNQAYREIKIANRMESLEAAVRGDGVAKSEENTGSNANSDVVEEEQQQEQQQSESPRSP